MTGLLDNKIVFITGGTSGIGRATVLIALREGATVCFTGRSQEHAEILLHEADAMGYDADRLAFYPCDMTDEGQVSYVVASVVERFNTIDCVFANAGRHMVGSIEDTTFAQWKSMFSVDVDGVFLTLKYTLPHMKESGGSIVLMGSDQCLIGKGASSAYGAAKGAIGQLTKSTAIDYAPYAIRVNCICPGTIDTPLARGAMQGFADKQFAGDLAAGVAFLEKAQPLQRLGTAEEVGETVVFMLSDKPGFMTGALVSIDGGYVAV